MSVREDAFVFECEGAGLLGVTHVPPRPATLGVLIVVGGPQYRVGAHRQFVLLARGLARSGFAVMRFDYRGMGDSTGPAQDFESIQADLHCAISEFLKRLPGLKAVVLWGLCDAASASACYAAHDERVAALVLANPWVRSQLSHARAMLQHYYRGRLLSPALWKKIFRGHFDWVGSARDCWRTLKARFTPDVKAAHDAGALPDRMLRGLKARRVPALFILSGNDLVAAEFRSLVAHSREWGSLLACDRVRIEIREDADHTFSSARWRDEVADITRAWMLDLARRSGH